MIASPGASPEAQGLKPVLRRSFSRDRFSGLARSVIDPAFRPGSARAQPSGGPFKVLLAAALATVAPASG